MTPQKRQHTPLNGRLAYSRLDAIRRSFLPLRCQRESGVHLRWMRRGVHAWRRRRRYFVYQFDRILRD